MTRELPAWAREVADRLAPGRVCIDGLWANPGPAVLERVYAAAAKSVPRVHGEINADSAQRQAWLRKVHVEFHRRLRAAGIYVETQEGL